MTKLNRESLSPLSVSTEADMRLYFEDTGGTSNAGPSPFASLMARTLYKPIERPDDLRCGPVYVKTPAHQAHYVEPEVDQRAQETDERRTRIGLQLEAADLRWARREKSGTAPSEVMRLFFGEREQPWRKGLGRYANLVDLTEAFAEH